MSRVLIAPPNVPALSLADCKAVLGITGSDQDAALTAAIAAVTGTLDPASGGWLARALRPQTWELRLHGFYPGDELSRYSGFGGYGGYAGGLYGDDHDHIEIPYPALISVDNIAYDDSNGVAQMLVAGTDYRVFGGGGFNKAYLRPAYGKSWPSGRWDTEAVRIRFTCGYAPAVVDPATADAMPAAIKSAIALGARQLSASGARDLFVSVETVDGVSTTNYIVSQNAAAVIREQMESLLLNFRVVE